ncbi:hypothetical protein MNR01_05610 [Lysobacter sp. S4-A87]|uniref:hypothetical protein n=1 Tax=Lysobacter sp. S4-A87 TaxID=2925843 RepID=UPI001F53B9D3|nr:hypothetical protein [Lysobacter sp. S4-A87]UNK50483.1 hypothetical protein MNR01_05610 [Lysobacter sp. S4-A87]
MLDETQGYAVFLYPQALEALGEAIRPYLHDGPSGPHVLCNSIDTGGALIEMTIEGRTSEGHAIAVELMVPANMVRMIVSARSDGVFGFGPRVVVPAADVVAVPPTALASAQTVHAPVEIPMPVVDPVTPVMAKLPPKV